MKLFEMYLEKMLKFSIPQGEELVAEEVSCI